MPATGGGGIPGTAWLTLIAHPPVLPMCTCVLLQAVQTARATTQVVDGFTLLHSKDFSDPRQRPNTLDWLRNLTRSIAHRYSREAEQAPLPGAGQDGGPMSFAELAERVKQEEERALACSAPWQLMLMATPGVSQGAAEAIAARYPSPASLLQAVRQAGRTVVAVQL